MGKIYTQPIYGGMMCPDPDDGSVNWDNNQNRPGHTLGQKNQSCNACILYRDKWLASNNGVRGSHGEFFSGIRSLWEEDQDVTEEQIESATSNLVGLLKELQYE